MRGIWIDTGNDPIYEKLTANGITWVYFPLSDPPAAVRDRLLEVKRRGLKGGVYSAWNWWGGGTGAQYAERTHNALKLVAPDATNTWPKVMLNNEEHLPDQILGMLNRWRQLRPNTDTAWTMEGMQGGWMMPAFVDSVMKRKVRLVPQSYTGPGMRPTDALTVARDLTHRGFVDSLVSPFYDAAALPLLWQGFAFTQGRLP